jgi:hypothetical protein
VHVLLFLQRKFHKNLSFIKSKGQEWTGVAPLKNKMGFLQSDNKSKAEILNEQFQSVFPKENLNSCPNKGNSPDPCS